jgi:hypothetical protein
LVLVLVLVLVLAIFEVDDVFVYDQNTSIVDAYVNIFLRVAKLGLVKV